MNRDALKSSCQVAAQIRATHNFRETRMQGSLRPGTACGASLDLHSPASRQRVASISEHLDGAASKIVAAKLRTPEGLPTEVWGDRVQGRDGTGKPGGTGWYTVDPK